MCAMNNPKDNGPQKKSPFSGFLKHNKKSLVFGVATGVLTGTSYIPFPPWALFFFLAPLWWYWLYQAQDRKQILFSGFIAQFVLNIIGFHWVFHTAHEFGHIPWPLSFIVLLLFSSLAHLYFPLLGLLFFELKKWLKVEIKTLSPFQSMGLVFFLSGLWCLTEIYWPYLFQWHMGYTLLSSQLPIYHWADTVGFQGLSFILLLFNGFIVMGINATFLMGRFLKYLFLVLVIFTALNISGWWHGKSWETKNIPNQSVVFLPIQANIGNTEKIMAERGLGYQDHIVDRFISLSEKAIERNPQSQILVWPESAIPDYLDSDYSNRPRAKKIKKFLNQNQKMLITGAYSKEFVPSQKKTSTLEERSYNSLFAFDERGELSSPPYRKHKLLAFGEYTPFAKWFPYLNEISPAGSGFNVGPGPSTTHISRYKFAPQICYESLYPDDIRQSVLSGAQFLVNITNDSWFGPYSEPYQHLYMTFARAIENRRPLLRVTNTGITSTVDAKGNSSISSPLFKEWAEPITLNFESTPTLTLFTRYGGFLPMIVLFMATGGFLSVIFKRNKK